MSAPSPVPVPDRVVVHPGPALLAGLESGPWLPGHRARFGPLPDVSLDDLLDRVGRVGVAGRGGAAFPFATKLATAARGRRPVVVVNLAEGEPVSAKDTALALTRPHLVLDGAVATARALRAREVHVVLPGERPRTSVAVLRALDERRDPVRVRVHTASPAFVAGQARAVLELMAGRPNLPVTAWQPEAVAGHTARPTLLSNAETWAHVAHLLLAGDPLQAGLGTTAEPGTTLLTISREGALPEVREVAHGTPWRDVLADVPDRPAAALVGGFHGTWAPWDHLERMRVSRAAMRAEGMPLGAGIVHVPAPTTCPLALTADVLAYLADQSAHRCGPCLNGLPALAVEFRGLVAGRDGTRRVERLAALVDGRGACAHPDGTVRLVRSALAVLGDEVEAHRTGRCATRSLREVTW